MDSSESAGASVLELKWASKGHACDARHHIGHGSTFTAINLGIITFSTPDEASSTIFVDYFCTAKQGIGSSASAVYLSSPISALGRACLRDDDLGQQRQLRFELFP